MSAAPARHQSVRASGEVAVEIEVWGRWDALALSELLTSFHSFLVHHGSERWVVHAKSPGSRGEPLAEALAAIDEWAEERAIEAAVRIEGRPRRNRG